MSDKQPSYTPPIDDEDVAQYLASAPLAAPSLPEAVTTPRNQCDGCQSGAPLHDGRWHLDGAGRAFMVCQAYRY